MKKTFFQICFVFVILAISMTGCGPSEKDITEKKQLEAKVVDLENKLQKVTIIESTKAAMEEHLIKGAPPNSIAKCTSVALKEKNGQNDWKAECEIVYIIPPPEPMSGVQKFSGILRISGGSDNQPLKVDVSAMEPVLTAEEIEIRCRSNLKGLALNLMLEEIDGRFPDRERFQELIKTEDFEYCNVCPGSNIPYTYIPGLYDGMNPRLTLVYCSYHEKDGKVLQAKVTGEVNYDKVVCRKAKEEMTEHLADDESDYSSSSSSAPSSNKLSFEEVVCRKAKEEMTELLAGMKGSNAPTCTSVIIVKKVSKTRWIGKATARNGKSGEISIDILVFDENDLDPALMVMPVNMTDFYNPFE